MMKKHAPRAQFDRHTTIFIFPIRSAVSFFLSFLILFFFLIFHLLLFDMLNIDYLQSRSGKLTLYKIATDLNLIIINMLCKCN